MNCVHCGKSHANRGVSQHPVCAKGYDERYHQNWREYARALFVAHPELPIFHHDAFALPGEDPRDGGRLGRFIRQIAVILHPLLVLFPSMRRGMGRGRKPIGHCKLRGGAYGIPY